MCALQTRDLAEYAVSQKLSQPSSQQNTSLTTFPAGPFALFAVAALPVTSLPVSGRDRWFFPRDVSEDLVLLAVRFPCA